MTSILLKRLKTVSILLAVGFLTVPGLIADQNIWVTGPSHKVLRNEKPDAPALRWIFDASQRTVHLYGAQNEFVAFQVVFSGPATDVTITPFTLKGPNGGVLDHVELFHEHYLQHEAISCFEPKHPVADSLWWDKYRRALGAPQEYPVQMVPFNAKSKGAPFDVADGMNEVAWIDIFVPEGTPAGVYTGTMRAGAKEFRVSLEVWDFALPSVSHFPCWGYVGPEYIAWSFMKDHRQLPGMMPIFDSYFQMGHNHRLSLMENVEYNKGYFTAPDRRYYDYYTGTAFKGPFGEGFGYELLPGDSRMNPDMMPIIEEIGFNRAFGFTLDEPGSKQAYEGVIARGEKLHDMSDGRLRTAVTEQYIPSKEDWPHLKKSIDIFISAGTTPDQVPAIEAEGQVVWTYNSGWVGGIYTDSPGPAPRSQAWAGYLTGSRAWYFWNAVYVADKHNRARGKDISSNPKKYRTDVWNVALNFDEATKPYKGGLYPKQYSIRINGDGLLFYPGYDVGVDGAIAGFRLKGLRQGSQDFEYLYLLDKMGRRDMAMAAAKQLITQKTTGKTSKDGQAGPVRLDYVKDPHQWDRVRIKLGKMLNTIGDKALRGTIKPYNQYPNPTGTPEVYDGKRF